VGGLKRTTYNGTTSGCPPPSQHHNYRRALHTQQRNHSERCNSGRFWKGVAQITRNRERAFTANLCSTTLFPNSSICHPDRCAGNNCVGFPLLALRANTESRGQGHSSAAKMVPEDVQRTALGFGRDIGRSLIAAAHARSTDAPRIRRLRRIAARQAASAPQATRLTIFFGQKKRFRFASGTPDADALHQRRRASACADIVMTALTVCDFAGRKLQ
jgi:hypothetical protein